MSTVPRSWIKYWSRFLAIFSVVCIGSLCNTTSAQETAQLRIDVRDQNGDAVFNYRVVLKNLENSGEQKKESVTGIRAAEFDLLMIGRYRLHVSAKGFKDYQQEIQIDKEDKTLKVILDIVEISETLEVRLSESERRFEESISKIYSKEEIAALPNDPERIKAELKRRYGIDVVFQVDGFTGGRIPDRSRIAAIKVIYNVFDAEFHDIGTPMVQITTKPGGDKWSGFLSVTHSNSSFSARNAFESSKPPSFSTSVFASITPPKISEKTSVSLSFSKSGSRKSQSFVGVIPNQLVLGNRESDIQTNFGVINLYQSLPKGHLGFLSYSISTVDGKGLGLGALDIAERAYRNSSRIHNLKYSQSGGIGQTYNHFRMEFTKSNSLFRPISNAPAIFIPGTVNFGGAGNETKSNSWRLEVADIVTFDHEKHLIKLGAELSYESVSVETSRNLNGTYTFADLDDFFSKRPISYSQRLAGNSARQSQAQISVFLQDYIRVAKNFQAGVGVRYEWQNTHSDFDNFSPRINLVWSPFKSSKLTIQAGLGFIYQWLETADLLVIENENRRDVGEVIISNPDFPVKVENLLISSGSNPSIKLLSDRISNSKLFYRILSIKYEFNKNLLLRGAYAQTDSRSIFQSLDINTPVKGARPNADFGRISELDSIGYRSIDKFGVSLDANFRGISVFAHYFYTKDITDSDSLFSLPSDSRMLRIDIGPTSGVRKHEFVVSSRMSLSEFFQKTFLRGFEFEAETKLASGVPYTITTGRDENLDTVINDRPAGVKRNSLRGSWQSQTDLAINWSISNPFTYLHHKLDKKSSSLTLRVAVNNLFNQTNKDGYVGGIRSPLFRKPTIADPARNFSFGLSYSF